MLRRGVSIVSTSAVKKDGHCIRVYLVTMSPDGPSFRVPAAAIAVHPCLGAVWD